MTDYKVKGSIEGVAPTSLPPPPTASAQLCIYFMNNVALAENAATAWYVAAKMAEILERVYKVHPAARPEGGRKGEDEDD